MNNSPLEFLAQRYGNVVKYDAAGNVAGIFVRFPKMKSSDLVAGLPAHTHPAFTINSVEQDSILLGKYKAGETTTNGPLKSLPNILPARSLGADQCLSRMKLAGPNITGMTVADYGFIKLLAQKHGWVPEGNTDWGSSWKKGTSWQTGKDYAVDNVRTFEGTLYTCLIAHTSSAELRPDRTPTHWARGKYVGGVSRDTGNPDSGHQTGYRTLNGTGPLEWYLGKDPGSLADIIGSSMEQQYGYRIVNMELQILPDNDAADPDADLSASSAAWKAILPNANDDGYTLVAPGTAGTLHWDYIGSKITLNNTVTAALDGTYKSTAFKSLAVNTENVPYVPSIVKELGLFPTGSADQTEGSYYIQLTADERFPRRGGYYSNTSDAGLGYVNSSYSRSNANSRYGCRPRSL